MRRIILFMVTSLDGFVAGPNGELDWENRDPEVGGYLIPELLESVDSMIIGRVLFEGFRQHWPALARDPAAPKELVQFARWLDNAPKAVFSRTLEKADWTNSELVRPENDAAFVAAIEALKRREGKDLVLFGGVRFAQTCARLGLVDEYRFKQQSIALGKGQALFGGLAERRRLALIRTKEFKCGVVAQYYQAVR